ncbi:PD-(D/E)XK nuclease family protein [Nocardioides sp. KC13]|uniref:PD-(D/E)XK nuclease family protein n=1 Tax=Nocardioides turkmenicus TaxID=2711220 RepID=A0A6M1QTI8_9ACTN|nr:PD-(D/E)XK nuclease family protein [Nocardioides sp. KC13]
MPATPGIHAEREVCSDALRLTGRIDLLVIDDADVTVIDFKTGEEDADHDNQVRLYALLWHLDDQTNPEGRPATRLEVAYPSRTRAVEPLDQAGLSALESSTVTRVAAANANTETASPMATPSPEGCQFCQVKHLCDVYWPTIPPAVSEPARRSGSTSKDAPFARTEPEAGISRPPTRPPRSWCEPWRRMCRSRRAPESCCSAFAEPSTRTRMTGSSSRW